MKIVLSLAGFLAIDAAKENIPDPNLHNQLDLVVVYFLAVLFYYLAVEEKVFKETKHK